MKLKLTIALVILALVLGMVLVACDDGDLPKIEPKEKDGVPTEKIVDMTLIPFLDKDGKTQNMTDDTTGNEVALEDVDLISISSLLEE